MKKEYFVIFFTFIVLVSPLIQWGVSSWWSDGARMSTIQAIVEKGSFQIDNTLFESTGDKFLYKGHFYSDKPPFLQIYGALWYAILYYFFNFTMVTHHQLIYFILTFLCITVTAAIGLIYFYKILDFFNRDNRYWNFFVTFLAGFASLIFPYSTVFHNHIVAGSLITISFYYLLKINEKSIYSIISGVILSVAGGVDINSFLLIPLALIVLYKEPFKKIVLFYLGTVPVLIFYFVFNYHISGSILPPSMNWKLFDFEGSSFEGKMMDGMSGYTTFEKLIPYAIDMLFWNRGLILHMPLIIFVVYGFFVVFSKKEFLYKRYFAFILISFVIVLFLIVFRTVDYGGNCFGPRWIGVLLPLVYLPIAFLNKKIKESKIIFSFFIFFGIYSILISVLGSVDAFTKIDFGLNSILACFIIFTRSGYIFKIVVLLITLILLSIFFFLIKIFSKRR